MVLDPNITPPVRFECRHRLLKGKYTAKLSDEHLSQKNITFTKYNLANPWKNPKQIHQIEFVARDLCISMFPHKDTLTSILAAQCKEPAAEIKGRGINIIHD